MCWNAEVSLNTFIIGVISATILVLLNNTPYLYIFIGLSVSFMQLLEYFTWTNINNKKIIKILSIFGIITIITQVFLIIFLIKNKKYRNLMLSSLMIFLLIYINFIFPTTKLYMEKGKNGHLIWHWIDVNIIWFIITFLFYTIPLLLNRYYTIFSFLLMSIIICMYFFYKYKTFGTIWCYISNIIWIYLLYNSIIKFSVLE